MTADREALSGEIARVLGEHRFIEHIVCVCGWDGQADRRWTSHRAHLADALADLLAARDRRVRAEALREAAGDTLLDFSDRHLTHSILRNWLTDRADRIEATP